MTYGINELQETNDVQTQCINTDLTSVITSPPFNLGVNVTGHDVTQHFFFMHYSLLYKAAADMFIAEGRGMLQQQ